MRNSNKTVDVIQKSIVDFRERRKNGRKYGNTSATSADHRLILYSYTTPIVVIDREHKTRLVDWTRYSNTTARYTAAFLRATDGMPEFDTTLHVSTLTRPAQSVPDLIQNINAQLAIIRAPRKQLKTKQAALSRAQEYMRTIAVLVERYAAPTGAEVETMKLILGTDGEVARVLALTALLTN